MKQKMKFQKISETCVMFSEFFAAHGRGGDALISFDNTLGSQRLSIGCLLVDLPMRSCRCGCTACTLKGEYRILVKISTAGPISLRISFERSYIFHHRALVVVVELTSHKRVSV